MGSTLNHRLMAQRRCISVADWVFGNEVPPEEEFSVEGLTRNEISTKIAKAVKLIRISGRIESGEVIPANSVGYVSGVFEFPAPIGAPRSVSLQGKCDEIQQNSRASQSLARKRSGPFRLSPSIWAVSVVGLRPPVAPTQMPGFSRLPLPRLRVVLSR